MGRYHVLRKLGEGGMGCVYEAYDPDLDRKIALKILRPGISEAEDSPRMALIRSRLVREAKSLAKLTHPNVVPIFDVGIVDETSVYLAMELVAGLTLDRWLLRDQPTWQSALEPLLQVGEGLAAAHAAGLLHRDIKPANIIVGLDGLARVLDFGLAKNHTGEPPTVECEGESTRSQGPLAAKLAGSSTISAGPTENGSDVTQAGTLLGTPSYLPPEILRGAPFEPSADIFAFGCVMFEALNFIKPFPTDLPGGRDAAIKTGKLHWSRPVPLWLRSIVAQTLAFDPQARGQGIAEILTKIRAGQRRARNIRGSIGGLGLLLVPAAGILAWNLVAQDPEIGDPDCADPAAHLATTLNKATLDQAEDGFQATKLELAEALWERAEIGLSTWREKWLQARRHLCPAYRMQSGFAAFERGEREQARACLDESRSEVRTLLEIWAGASTRQVMESEAGLGSLSAPQSCSDLESLQQRTPLPANPVQREWVLEQRGRLKEIETRVSLADYDGAERALDELHIPVDVPENLALLAEMKLQEALLLERRPNTLLSSRSVSLQRALLWNIAADRARAANQSSEGLWFARAYLGRQLDESDELLSTQHASLVRANSDGVLARNYLRNLGISEAMRGNLEQTVVHFERALISLDETNPKDMRSLSRFLEDLAVTHVFLGKPETSLPYQRKSTAVASQIYPPGHPMLTGSYGRLAASYLRANRPSEGYATLAHAATACNQAEIPLAMCLDVQAKLPGLQASLGRLSEAIDTNQKIVAVEEELGRRKDPVDSWALSQNALLLKMRGEINAAWIAAQASLVRIDAEGDVPPNALFRTLRTAIDLALTREDLKSAAALFSRAREILKNPNEESRSMEETLAAQTAQRLLLQGFPVDAIHHAERALALAIEANSPALDRSGRSLLFAKTLLAANQIPLAHHYAEEALMLLLSVEGPLPHLRVPIHELLARIALAEARYGDALVQLEQAYLFFDSVEVLDNRLAPLRFIEAQTWWALNPSKAVRIHAHGLAQSALKEYQDWDSGAASSIRSVRQWLATRR
jgi:tetratricopeptide (TPR) repeat protein